MDEFEAAMVGRDVGRSEAAQIVTALRAQLDLEVIAHFQEVARLREALEDARHSLVTLHGLTASDGLSAYGDALAEGCDATGAWDCYVEETWQIDEMATIAEIDAALAATRGIAPAPATSTPDPLDVCECGHEQRLHNNLETGCGMWDCGCEGFTPKRGDGQG